MICAGCIGLAALAACNGRPVEDDARPGHDAGAGHDARAEDDARPENDARAESDARVETGAQTFSIYLAADSTQKAYDHTQADLDTLELQDDPLLTVEDITSYSWQEHAFTLAETSDVVFPQPGVYGLPFVIMSRHERQYLGGLWTMISSVAYGEPAIYVDGRTNSRTYVIEWGYPPGTNGAGPDPRNNPTIKEALRDAGKLLP